MINNNNNKKVVLCVCGIFMQLAVSFISMFGRRNLKCEKKSKIPKMHLFPTLRQIKGFSQLEIGNCNDAAYAIIYEKALYS